MNTCHFLSQILNLFSCLVFVWSENVLKYFFAANFALPQAEAEGEETPLPLFKEIIFTELDREEAAKVVEEYNKVPKVLLIIHNKFVNNKPL